jgi:hypothetical protein
MSARYACIALCVRSHSAVLKVPGVCHTGEGVRVLRGEAYARDALRGARAVMHEKCTDARGGAGASGEGDFFGDRYYG